MSEKKEDIINTEGPEKEEEGKSEKLSFKDRVTEVSRNLYVRIGGASLLFLIYVLFVVATVRGQIVKQNSFLIDDILMRDTRVAGVRAFGNLSQLASEVEPLVRIINSDETMDTAELLRIAKGSTLVKEAAVVDEHGNGVDQAGNKVSYDLSGVSGNVDYSGAFFGTGDGVVFLRIVKIEGEEKTLLLLFDESGLKSAIEDEMSENSNEYSDWVVITDEKGNYIYVISDNDSEYITRETNIEDMLSGFISETAVKSLLGDMAKQTSKSKTFDLGGDERRIYYSPIDKKGWYIFRGIDSDIVKQRTDLGRSFLSSITFWMIVGVIFYVVLIVWIVMIEKNKGNVKNKGLTKLAETDQLTGLFNKISTENKIKEYMETHPDSQSMFFILDIDNFKKINDTMGHAFGDEVLREIGQRIKMEFRASDIIGRAGGDEFIIFLRNIPTNELIRKEAQKVLNCFKDFQVGTYSKYKVTASIGCSIFPVDGSEWESLYKAADQGLYKAKRGGKNQLVFYKEPAEGVDEKKEENETKEPEENKGEEA